MIDTHIHIEQGSYTEEWISRFAEQAASMGMEEIYLLEHSHRFSEFAPMYEEIRKYSDFQREWFDYEKRSIGSYQSLIEEMRRKDWPVRIKWGLEVCYFPEGEQLIAGLTRGFSYDFITGSVHWVNGFGFDQKAEYWPGIDVDRLYHDYYRLMIRLARSGLFTGLAHPDSIKCFGHYPTDDLTEYYQELAEELVRQGMYAEQSGGLVLNYDHPELGMNPEMLKIFLLKGVSIQTASDAHRPEDVGENIRELAATIAETE